MKAKCPNDPSHRRFITVAHVTEDWIVEADGHFIEVAPDRDSETTHGPDSGNIWQCAECGAEATVEP